MLLATDSKVLVSVGWSVFPSFCVCVNWMVCVSVKC